MLDRKVTLDNIHMITSLVMQGIGIGILTSLDVITEVKRGLLAFTRISDAILRPMTLALCTASGRTSSPAAGLVLTEFENSFAELGYEGALAGAPSGCQGSLPALSCSSA